MLQIVTFILRNSKIPLISLDIACKKQKKKGLYVVLNPALANKAIFPYLQYCDLIIPNEIEIQILGG